MPTFSKKDPKLGTVTVKTVNPAEIAELKANGFREDKPKQSQSQSSDKPKSSTDNSKK